MEEFNVKLKVVIKRSGDLSVWMTVFQVELNFTSRSDQVNLKSDVRYV